LSKSSELALRLAIFDFVLAYRALAPIAIRYYDLALLLQIDD
jgi:hypothetical protein